MSNENQCFLLGMVCNKEKLYRHCFSLCFRVSIRRVQVNQEGLKLNCAHQLLVYVDDVNILGGSVHAIKKNTEALVAASKKIGLEVNVDKTKYMVMSRDQDAGRSHMIIVPFKGWKSSYIWEEA